MTPPRINVDKDILIELIEKRYNHREIAKILKISHTTVGKILKEYNLSTKKKYEELEGKVFGKLKVIERLENSKDRRRVYFCKCECGNTAIVKAKYLNNGDTRSCGCYKNFDAYKEKNYKEVCKKIGEKYGMLTIIDVAMAKDEKVYNMVCRCECGNKIERKYSQILKIENPSCGCYAREIHSIYMSEIMLNKFKNNRNKNWYFIKDGIKIYCRSGYEVIYANYLMIKYIEFEYEPQCFKLGNGKRYTPDFYLVKENMYIEIKGIPYDIFDKSNQKQSVEMFRKNYNLDIYYWEDIYEKCGLPYKSYGHYNTKAKALGISVEDYLGKYIYLTY